MKIIPRIAPEPAPEPRELRVERPDPPQTAAPDLKDQMKDLLEEFAEHAVAGLHSLEQKMDQTQLQQGELVAKNSQAIAKLSEELGHLKKTLHELRSAPAPTPAPPSSPPPPSEPPRPDPMIPEALNAITREMGKLTCEMASLRKTVLDLKIPEPVQAVAVPEPAPISAPVASLPLIDLTEPLEQTPKKVALLTKLWDYLNQVAFEIPLGKQSH